MNKRNLKRNEGVALLLATIFILAGSIVLGALALRAVKSNDHVNQLIDYKDCFEGLEAAVVMAQVELNDGEDGMIGVSSSYVIRMDASNKVILPDFEETGIDPITLASMPHVEFFAFTQSWENDGIDNDGDGLIDESSEEDTFTTYAYARSRTAVRRLEVILRNETGSITNDTIFAGGGQAGALINGNVDIHGSVHLLGDDLPAGGTALVAMDLSGTTLISNNYNGLPASIAALIPSLETFDFNGEMVQSLEAELRVRNGLVSMSGNSHIGGEDVSGNAIKETMDGTFVTDGWTGNSVVADGGRGDPTNVYSDNGWDEEYDLGNQLSFPLFTDDWEWPEVRALDIPQLPAAYGGVPPAKGSTELNAATGAPYTFNEFYTEVLSDGPLDFGNIVIDTREKFYWNSTDQTATGDGYFNELDGVNSTMTEADFDALDPTTFDPSEDYLYFDPATNTMYINGQIEIMGNFTFDGAGSDDTIEYVGRGSILVQGDVLIDTNLMVANTNGQDSFPVNNVLSLMARDDMIVGTVSQLKLMGAFYAGNQLISAKQTTTVGMFVANFFNMGNQVPSIFGVPDLRQNLPFGVNFEIEITIVVIRAWRDLGGTTLFERGAG